VSSPPAPQKFHLVHIHHPGVHTTMGYREVVETLHWGLQQLGHDATLAINTFAADRVNIVVGGQLLSPADIERIPQNSIIYNLEQLANVPSERLRQTYRLIAPKFRVWDYSASNLPVWQQLSPSFPPTHVPIAWGANLQRIPKQEEDIDVLFYGIPSPTRLTVFNNLCMTLLKSVYVCGLYGPSRDSLIARSKIILNINVYDQSQIFEVVRVSYLLANEKAVVSDIYPGSHIEPDLKDAIAFAPLEKIPETCANLIKDEPARKSLAQRGRQAFERRDIRPILQNALSSID
jgi:hypothetical protein